MLIHANDHATSSTSSPSSPSPPSPPPPPLVPPVPIYITRHLQSCPHYRRQVSPSLTARLVFVSCRGWPCRFDGADASPRYHLAATSTSPRCW